MQAMSPGPLGDPTHHQPLAALEAGLRARRPASPTSGRVLLLVRRLANGARETPASVRLDRDEGLAGDDWSRRPPRDPEAQLAVMHRDVAELIANGQPLTLFGDNLFVDIDLAAENQQSGARFRVGGAIVEATPMPHNGCAKFHQRFGADALRFVQAPPTRDQNLRGVYWKVIEPGDVRIGDPIERLALQTSED
jgi:MOSC domain-containing protein YiiM